MIKKIIITFFSMIFFSSLVAAEKDQEVRLKGLFKDLQNTFDLTKARKIEDEIWDVWTTHPSEETLTSLLKKGSNYMSQNQLTSAHNVFSKAIELDPNWAEAWNKRATVLYLMGNFELSQNDIDMVLSLEKRHFGALAGQGMVQTAMKNYQKAIDSYIEAHRVYPAMRTPLIMIEKLKVLIQKESI